MNHTKKLVSILLRNEEWLISKILNSAREYKQPGYAALMNHSWMQLVKNFTEIINTAPTITDPDKKKSIAKYIEENAFNEFGISEAEKCYQREIKPSIYLSFLKTIRHTYIELIFDSPINSSEKNEFIWLINDCFDSLEIAFTNGVSEIENKGKLIQPNNFFQLVFETISLPVLLIDSFHKIVNFNSAAALFFPFLNDKENHQKRSLRFDNDQLNLTIDEFRASESDHYSFETSVHLNNKLLFVQVGLARIPNSDNILASFVNLTNWKEAEQNLETSRQKAENSDSLKTAFLANMSHEIRTPLNAIVGFAELLIMANPAKEDRIEYLNLIKKSSNDLLNIIEDIIDIAKIESKQLKICPKNISLFELYSDLESIYSEQISRQGKGNIKIELRIPEEEKKLVLRTDPKRLKQVLSNLIGNAIKFTDNGTIEIGYKIAENKLVYFFVKDTGIGIPANMQKKVFDRFVQVEDTCHKNANGTGLGLAISRNIVNLLGGNIWVSSKENKGSNFYFYLPIISGTEKVVTLSRKEIAAEVDVDLSKSCVLIAEDEDTNFLYMREALKPTGITIIRSKNGMEAINQVETNNAINLILMDIKMPEVSGLEAARYINHIKPQLPIIALTAFAMDNDRQTCLNAGCVDYFAKPIAHEKLIALIKKYVSLKSVGALNKHLA
jgi:signal transduction histidine kinase/CheY-like chemotaxis protein